MPTPMNELVGERRSQAVLAARPLQVSTHIDTQLTATRECALLLDVRWPIIQVSTPTLFTWVGRDSSWSKNSASSHKRAYLIQIRMRQGSRPGVCERGRYAAGQPPESGS